MPALLSATHPSAQESTEERFRAVFGAHRTPFSSRPESVRFPNERDYENPVQVGFTDTSHVLFYLEAKDDDDPFLWVTDGTMGHMGSSYEHISYCSSRNLWREDAPRELAALAPALCRARDEVSPSHGFEWVAACHPASVAKRLLCFSGETGEYARITCPPATDSKIHKWGAESFRSDPARAWDEIMTTLIF